MTLTILEETVRLSHGGLGTSFFETDVDLRHSSKRKNQCCWTPFSLMYLSKLRMLRRRLPSRNSVQAMPPEIVSLKAANEYGNLLTNQGDAEFVVDPNFVRNNQHQHQLRRTTTHFPPLFSDCFKFLQTDKYGKSILLLWTEANLRVVCHTGKFRDLKMLTSMIE